MTQDFTLNLLDKYMYSLFPFKKDFLRIMERIVRKTCSMELDMFGLQTLESKCRISSGDCKRQLTFTIQLVDFFEGSSLFLQCLCRGVMQVFFARKYIITKVHSHL